MASTSRRGALEGSQQRGAVGSNGEGRAEPPSAAVDFGSIRATRLVPIGITPHRFRTKRPFWSDCGLGIVTRSSSDWAQATDGAWIKARAPLTRGLSRQHNHFLKSIFKGS
ncbi:MAG: hypothetical protein CL908_13945 [Deltaproteobacteria bacterium]|nr:hypothetical protein [Deltaproteobacteria bacterium]